MASVRSFLLLAATAAEVADETMNPAYFVPGEHALRWLNVGMAISIQEMRPHQ